MILVLSLPEFTGSFAIITNILGFRVGIWGTSHGVANAAQTFLEGLTMWFKKNICCNTPWYGMLLHSPFGLCHYGSHIRFLGLVMV